MRTLAPNATLWQSILGHPAMLSLRAQLAFRPPTALVIARKAFGFLSSLPLWKERTPLEKVFLLLVFARIARWVTKLGLAKAVAKWMECSRFTSYVAGRLTRPFHVTDFVPKQNDDGKIIILKGQRLYTDPVSHITYRLQPKSARGRPGDEAQVDYEMVVAGLEENALVSHGGVFETFKVSDPSAFVLYLRTEAGDVRAAHGYRDHNMGIVNRHVFQGPDCPFPGKFSNAYIRKCGSDVVFPIPSGTPIYFHGNDPVRYTGDDLAAFDPGPVFWSRVGIKAHSEKGFSVDTDGPVYMEYYDSAGKYVRASGHLQPTTQEDRAKGRIPYTIETERGCSGSPVFKLINGVPKIIAIHAFGSVDSRPVNFGIVIPDLIHFKKHLGLVADAPKLMGDEKTESRSKAEKQQDRWEEQQAAEWFKGLSKADRKRYLKGELWYDPCNADAPDVRDSQYTDQITTALDDLTNPYGPYEYDGRSDSSSDHGGFSDCRRVEEEAATVYDAAKATLLRLIEEAPPGLRLEECTEFCEARKAFNNLKALRNKANERKLRRDKQRAKRASRRSEKTGGAEQALGPTNYRKQWDPTIDMPVVHDGPFHSSDPDLLGEALAEAMSGTVTGLEAIFRHGRFSPGAIRRHPKFRLFNDYHRAGDVQFHSPEHVEYDAEGKPVLTAVATFCGIHTRSAPQKNLSNQFRKVCECNGLEMDDFIIPSNTPEEIMESLKGQLRGTKAIRRELTDEQHQILHDFYELYPDAPHPYVGDVHEGVQKTLASLDGDKSTGWSALYRPGCKEVWKTAEGMALASYLTRCRLILRLAWGAAAMGCMTPAQMVEEGLQDPRVLFIKPEPHGRRKRATKQWRLIWVCSMIDILCAAQTHRSQDKRDIAAYQDRTHPDLPQVIGMGHHDLGIERLGEELDKVAAVNGKLYDSDCSGWDISVQRQWVMWDAKRRLVHGPSLPVFRELLYCEAFATTAHVVAVGRRLYSVNKAGITASGILSTGANNSSERAAIKKLAGAKQVRTLGDDEFNSGADKDKEAWLGVRTKGDVHECGPCGPINFTSHEFVKINGKWQARFMNLDKMLARIELSKADDGSVEPTVLGGCLFVLRHDPHAERVFRDVCSQMGWSLEGVIPFYDENTSSDF